MSDTEKSSISLLIKLADFEKGTYEDKQIAENEHIAFLNSL